ncbi:uncharacterized protein PAC_14150 [Phialocephala subalpina]|uniref:Uncharacterized protein n=1 Tax=Phialocephala subalpina TaxID=576137 RepID=A0A1L7XGV8_9HELO|nr:uncharacterized protein PAC_14150 [Phialocephala subalpina]
MSSPGGSNQQGGAGSSNGGSGDQGNQGNPAQATTTTTSQGHATSTQSPFSSSTQTSPSNSTSTSSSSSSNKTAIIGGVVGGIAGLLVLALIGIWFLNRRKKRQIALKNGTAQPVTYAGLNSSFGGVPFGHNRNQSAHDGLTPRPLLASSPHSSQHPDIEMRGGNRSPVESDMFLPTYAESQAAMSVRGTSTIGRLNTSHSGTPSTNVSPLSTSGTRTLHNMTPDLDLPPMPPLPQTAAARDTMGFPIDSPGFPSPGFPSPGLASPSMASPGFETIHLQPEIPLPIISPTPRHPLVHQDSLERQVRAGMMPTDSPELSHNINPNRLRVLSQEMPRESPILGLNSVTIQQPAAAGPSTLNPSVGIDRHASQRTVSSMSSMPPVVSDAELENLGVGTRPMKR